MPDPFNTKAQYDEACELINSWERIVEKVEALWGQLFEEVKLGHMDEVTAKALKGALLDWESDAYETMSVQELRDRVTMYDAEWRDGPAKYQGPQHG